MEHHCGIIAMSDNTNNIKGNLIANLNKLQHRGYESCGISFISNDINSKNIIKTIKGLGTVKSVFPLEPLESLESQSQSNNLPNFNRGIGHVRYSTVKKTTEEKMLEECQPFQTFQSSKYNFSLAHNGNIPTIKNIIKKYNIEINTNSDTFAIVKLIEKILDKYKNWNDTLKFIMNTVPGSYCFVILTENNIYALRDRYGIRPLVYGKSNSGFCIASETIALNNYKYVRDILPGEIVCIDFQTNKLKLKLKKIYQHPNKSHSFCSFELIYFMSDKSKINNITNNEIRYKLGYKLGESEINIIENSIVVCLPNTSIPNAKGFANAINKPYYDYIKKRKGMGRTFILNDQEKRAQACINKFLFDEKNLINKEIYLVDDSIVRGTTMKTVIKILKNIGVKSIHVRIMSPLITDPCYFGIDMSTKNELISFENNNDIDNIKKELNVDSLKYISIDEMKNVFNANININVCTSCFTGNYNNELLDW